MIVVYQWTTMDTFSRTASTHASVCTSQTSCKVASRWKRKLMFFDVQYQPRLPLSDLLVPYGEWLTYLINYLMLFHSYCNIKEIGEIREISMKFLGFSRFFYFYGQIWRWVSFKVYHTKFQSVLDIPWKCQLQIFHTVDARAIWSSGVSKKKHPVHSLN